jgi:hypothetical protein
MGAVGGLVGIEGGVVSGVINLESPGVGAPGRDHAMRNVTTELELLQSSADVSPHLFEDWFDPIEEQLRKQIRGFIEG